MSPSFEATQLPLVSDSIIRPRSDEGFAGGTTLSPPGRPNVLFSCLTRRWTLDLQAPLPPHKPSCIMSTYGDDMYDRPTTVSSYWYLRTRFSITPLGYCEGPIYVVCRGTARPR